MLRGRKLKFILLLLLTVYTAIVYACLKITGKLRA